MEMPARKSPVIQALVGWHWVDGLWGYVAQ